MHSVRARRSMVWIFLSGLALSASAKEFNGVWDEPSSFIPGRYFEHKAQFYLKNKDYRAALEMFELTGFWGNKLSQYNAAAMQFNGIGVPVDKVRGVAWLRIAAESHGDVADNALKAADAELNDAQRVEAEALWRELDAKYGNKVTLDRALARYQSDLRNSTGHGIWKGNLQVYETGGHGTPVTGEAFDKTRDKEFAAFIEQLTGSVTVGKVRTLAVPDDVKGNASTTRIDGGDASPRR